MVSSINSIKVKRTLSSGEAVGVGEMATDKQGRVFFAYDDHYIQNYPSLSPFKLPFNTEPNQSESNLHKGLYGVFSDSLPDGWGLMLMDKQFLKSGMNLHEISPLHRLAYIGGNGMGALTYKPSCFTTETDQFLTLNELGKASIELYEGSDKDVLPAITIAGGSPGGARPKALIGFDGKIISTHPNNKLPQWIIKFGSDKLLLKHEEGLVESIYLDMAKLAGCNTPEYHLFDNPLGTQWLALKRFDVTYSANNIETGRLHMHSVCGLLNADFRAPSIDYQSLIRATQVLTKHQGQTREMFRRGVFNLLSGNCDDHSKNFAFLQNDEGKWQLSPFFDVCFSPTPHQQQTSSLLGHGKAVPHKAITELAREAGITKPSEIKKIISQCLDAIAQFDSLALKRGISPKVREMISNYLNGIIIREHSLIKKFS